MRIVRLFKRNENGKWYVEFRRGLKRSLNTKDEKEARVRLRDLEREILRGKLVVLEKKSSITLKEFCAEYETWLQKNRAYNTWDRVHSLVPKLLDALGPGTALHAIKKRDMDKYIEYCRERGNAPGTINIEIRHIKAMFSKTTEDGWDYLTESPFAKVKQIKYFKTPPGFIKNLEDVEKIFKAIGKNKTYRLVFALYIYTGGRRSEINKLEWADIKLPEGVIVFRERKNYEQLSVPIVEKLYAILNEYEFGEGRIFKMSAPQMARTIKSYLTKAGLGNLKPHALRHTFASHLLMSGVDIKTVQALLGQTSLRATEIYTHLIDDHKKKQIYKLPY